MIKLTTEEFIARAKDIHGSKYSYANTQYTGCEKLVRIKCLVHGVFEQTAKTHLRGQGCKKCNGGVAYTNADFVRKAKAKHERKYKYAKCQYLGAGIKVTITCKVHGDFQQTPRNHLYGQGCPKCTDISSLCTEDDFIERAYAIHGEYYDYSEYEFVNVTTKGKIVCPEHGAFYRNMDKHLRHKSGCPSCNAVYSKAAVEWIKQEARCRRLKNVLHAENGGEFYIKEARAYADGYHERTKTIFEFYGDRFHGNPKIFKPNSRPHPFNKSVTAKQLYRKTVARHNLLEKLGFTVVHIWENEFKMKYSINKTGVRITGGNI